MAKLLRVTLAILLIFCLFAYLANALAHKTTDARTMLEKLTLYADGAASSITEDQYPAVAASITGFLAGKLPSPSPEVEGIAFAPHEVQHLVDIRELVQLANVLRWVAIGLVAAGLLVFFWVRKAKPEVLAEVHPEASLRIACIAFFALLVGIVIWGVFDFDGLFTAFHKLLFRNDLWLLDPQQDPLLQLMPTPFFISYGVDLLRQNAFLLLILPLAAFGLRGRRKEAA